MRHTAQVSGFVVEEYWQVGLGEKEERDYEGERGDDERYPVNPLPVQIVPFGYPSAYDRRQDGS